MRSSKGKGIGMRVNTLYGTKEIVAEQGYPMVLQYYLIQDLGLGQITYGIRIDKTEGETKEQECLPGLSHSCAETEGLLRQMMYNLVTPVTAAEVADDWISSREER